MILPLLLNFFEPLSEIDVFSYHLVWRENNGSLRSGFSSIYEWAVRFFFFIFSSSLHSHPSFLFSFLPFCPPMRSNAGEERPPFNHFLFFFFRPKLTLGNGLFRGFFPLFFPPSKATPYSPPLRAPVGASVDPSAEFF